MPQQVATSRPYIKRQLSKLPFQAILADAEEVIPVTLSMTDKVKYTYHSYAKWATEKSRKVVLGFSKSELPNKKEIVAQSRILMRDYMDSVLHKQCNFIEKTAPKSDVSYEILLLGAELEKKYPHLYKDIGVQININISKRLHLYKAYSEVSDKIFHDGVTWGRIISLFAMTGALAVEAIHHGQPSLLSALVDMFSDAINRYAAKWIALQGGWTSLTKVFRSSKDASMIWMLSAGGFMSGLLGTCMMFMQFL